jgi:hypothetical protein
MTRVGQGQSCSTDSSACQLDLRLFGNEDMPGLRQRRAAVYGQWAFV